MLRFPLGASLGFRILDKQKSPATRSRRAWSAGLLLMALLALVLGVFGAIYFEGAGGGSPPQVANNAPPSAAPESQSEPQVAPPPVAAAPSENKPQNQAAAPPEPGAPAAPAPALQPAQAPPDLPAPAAPAPTETLSQYQSATPQPSPDSEAQRLAQISPSAAPANVAAAAPRYWVEFGAYNGSFYADRLKQSLGKLGIEAVVTNAPGKHGRRYMRVRTVGDSDRPAAAAQIVKARSALRIKPLLHRIAAISPGAARLASPAPSGRHWVQFGAFRARAGAERIRAQLRKSDIQAFVLEIKYSGHAPLYLVRVPGLDDRAAAEHVAQQGAAALHSNDVLIGESRIAPGLHPRPPPR